MFIHNMTSSRLVSYLLVFIFGATCFWLFEWRMASTPRSGHPIEQPIPITMSQIAEQDKWITNYQIYAIPLNKIDSKREYLLLLLERKEDTPEIALPNQISWFTLNGFANKDDKLYFAVKPSEMKEKPSNIHTVLFDYESGFLHRDRVIFTEKLELSSMKMTE